MAVFRSRLWLSTKIVIIILIFSVDPPIGTEHCDWLYGIFGHETSCTRYWTCWNGTATEQLCIGGLLYNEKTHSCDWPDNVEGCQKHREFFEITEENFQKIIFFFFSALCNEDANGNVALGKSCNRYWQCQGGYPRLQRCPAMLVFDRRSLRCVVPPTEDCDIPSTIPPPPPEEEGDENIPQNNPKFANLPPGAIPVPSKSRNWEKRLHREITVSRTDFTIYFTRFISRV